MKATILAAGVGERMHPLTHTQPKPLIPVAGRPILDHIIDTLKAVNISDIKLVVGYLKDQIKERYGDGTDYGVNISYVEQPEQKGTADAISYTEYDESFVVINGDVYCDAESLRKAVNRHNDEEAIVTLGTYRVENAASYGVIKTKNGKVNRIIEKPEEKYDQLINAGVYVFEPEIYEAIEDTPVSERNEKEITTSIELLVDKGELTQVSELKSWSHVGRPWDLLNANKNALENQDPVNRGEIEPDTHIGDDVTIEEGARVRAGAYIEGPAYIGKDSDIGPNCYIRPHTSIGKEVRIGNAVEVKNSIIMDGTHAAHHTYIGDSVIGRRCNFGAGTKVGNLRLDAENVKMKVKDEPTDTGRKKFGAVLGDEAQTGLNSMINPGVKIGPNSAIEPGVVLSEDLPPNRCIMVKQEKQERSWKNA